MERRQLKEQSKKMLGGKWGQFALFTLLFLICNGVLNALPLQSTVIDIDWTDGRSLVSGLYGVLPLWQILLYAAGRVVYTFILYGYVQMFMKTRIGMPTEAADLFKPFAAMPQRIICAALLNLAIEAVYRLLVFIAARLWVFGLPLIAALSVWYWIVTMRLSMVPIILSENPYTTVPNAFVQSYNVMRGYTLRYFVLMLSFLGWLLLCIPTIGIAMFWVVPYVTMTTVNFYYDIKAKQLGAQ